MSNDHSFGSPDRAGEGQDCLGTVLRRDVRLDRQAPSNGHFAQVQVNETLSFDFADEPEAWGGPGFDPPTGKSHHYAVHVDEAEFDAIFARVKAKGIAYGSGPYSHADGQLYARRGGRGFYFENPYGHVLEVMTVPETGS